MLLELNIVGNIGRDAEAKYLTDGSPVINFSVAYNESWKDKNGEKQEKTIWINCAYYTNSKIVDFLKKGQLVYISGFPDVEIYQRKDNSTGAGLRVRVEKIKLLGKKPGEGENNSEKTAEPATASVGADGALKADDDLPF